MLILYPSRYKVLTYVLDKKTASKKSIEIIGEISLICKWITAFLKSGLLTLNP